MTAYSLVGGSRIVSYRAASRNIPRKPCSEHDVTQRRETEPEKAQGLNLMTQKRFGVSSLSLVNTRL